MCENMHDLNGLYKGTLGQSLITASLVESSMTQTSPSKVTESKLHATNGWLILVASNVDLLMSVRELKG